MDAARAYLGDEYLIQEHSLIRHLKNSKTAEVKTETQAQVRLAVANTSRPAGSN
jgi:hypothetical protein